MNLVEFYRDSSIQFPDKKKHSEFECCDAQNQQRLSLARQ